ncbi:DedA family integral membrane protein [Trabulsiella guamensis ATCC 49490]|uniref:DedA family integral membrane protein n=1 Tax=Trabulsiella guamensis ATCC 49490 TaxID=1005994 RepID=A0A085AIJ8_9ENTR|nr:VTT domain-containing protein [Trabulsiella guamensis]KFC10043.1 DedA family integral membrane protein [Trabulsiella guamensis ATCC 49490]
MADVVNQLINTAQQHTVLISLIVFLLTFTKSCAIVSLVIPGTSGLLLLGPLSAGNVGLFAIMWAMASLGAISGFWLSWWIGKYYYHRIRHWRWLKLSIMEKSRVFLQRWGIYAVFLGRFISPLRATVPLASGMSGVTHRQFQLANISSAFIWTFILLVPGAISLGLMAD